jgi:DNA ligase (NAD+)
MDKIKNFSEILTHAKTTDKKNFQELLICLTNIYHNSSESEDILPDEYFDELVDVYEKRFETWNYTGAKVEKKTVKLPFWLGSMGKIKGSLPTEAEFFLKNWKKNYSGNYIIQDKLDGVSGLLVYSNGVPSLFTRGNGEEGVDISNLLKYIKVPKISENIAVRGELILSDEIFRTKYSSQFKNARNLVSGIVNSKKTNTKIAKDVEFICYELIEPFGFTIEEQFSQLETFGFKIPNLCSVLKKDLTLENLILLLQKFKQESKFYIDGIIIYDNSEYHIRNSDGNPEYAFAFKNLNEITIATVEEVIWNTSKYGVLVPKIKIHPVNLSGVTITYAAAFDAKYIFNNKIGPGTQVEITRSGDVIPYILRIVKSTKPQMPIEKFYWGKSGVNIYLDSSESQEKVEISVITNFFTQLKIKGLAKKTIESLYKGGLDTIHKIVYASLDQVLAAGFGPKQAENIIASISHGVKKVELSKLMAATTIFGVGLGSKKIKLVIDKFGENIFKMAKISKNTEEEIISLSGWSEISARQFIEKLPEFKKFLENNPKITYEISKTSSKGIFKGQNIVFSGFRDSDLEKLITKEGGAVKNSISTNTSLLITSNISQLTGKVKEATKLGVKIISRDEFTNIL